MMAMITGVHPSHVCRQTNTISKAMCPPQWLLLLLEDPWDLISDLLIEDCSN